MIVFQVSDIFWFSRLWLMGSSQSTSNSSNDCKHEGNGNMENFRSEKKQVQWNNISYYFIELFEDLKTNAKVDATANNDFKLT